MGVTLGQDLEDDKESDTGLGREKLRWQMQQVQCPWGGCACAKQQGQVFEQDSRHSGPRDHSGILDFTPKAMGSHSKWKWLSESSCVL